MSLQSSESPDNSVSMGSALGWRILNHFAEKGDEDKVKEFFDLIIQNEFCTVNNILIGPLVKVHVIKWDEFLNFFLLNTIEKFVFMGDSVLIEVHKWIKK